MFVSEDVHTLAQLSVCKGFSSMTHANLIPSILDRLTAWQCQDHFYEGCSQQTAGTASAG
jgi:hypothetical protein